MKRIGIGIFVVMLFFGMLFIPSLGMSEDNTMEKWMQDHTVKVNSTTTCKYEQGYLLVKEVYTGEELKERFGVEQFTKELKIPVEAKVLVEGKLRGMQEGEEKVFVTEKVTVLTSGDDPPHWWDNYTYPQWAWSKSGDIYEKEDPINLAWKNTTKDTAKSEILEEGWYDWGTWYDFYVYDPVDGWKDDDNVADNPFGIFGRYHARLWQMSDGNVVANAHHDTPVPHEADELEEAEELVSGYFNESEDTEWSVYEDSYNLDNNVTSPYSNGWCTQINYGHATWYVPDDYAKIQWAVDNASAGDTIIVKSSTYYENVNVNKQLILRGVDTGGGKPVVDAGLNGSAISLRADGIVLEGFKATNSYRGFTDAAGIKVFFSNNTTITGNNASNNTYGIIIFYSSNNTITGNTARNNDWNGIQLLLSDNNTITGNTASNNDRNGIVLDDISCYSCHPGYSSNNKIYLNNFINNDNNVDSHDSTNIWNSTSKITYVYNSSEFENYLGNYWDDYVFAGNDTNKDGIGDTPYPIDGDNDSYPLVEPFENYPAPAENIFDTEAPANPYPSIMGNHTGTITPNADITVSKLYAYPCEGTGGHTKSIEIYENNTRIANGTWNGYVGDWHNITIHNVTGGTPYVTLSKNHEYNYTIITGSYPQIHHNTTLLTTNGWINCTSFVDANGKKYDDWIPAIKLE